MPRRRKTPEPPPTQSEPPTAAASTPPKKRRRSPPRPRKTEAERTAALLEAHTKAIEKTKAEAAAKGTPNDWQVDTSWVDDFDAPFSVISVGPGDPKKTDEMLEAWAEFLVAVWLKAQRPDRG